MNILQSAKRNSDIKNMIKCENCGMFISEEDVKQIEGKNICNCLLYTSDAADE